MRVALATRPAGPTRTSPPPRRAQWCCSTGQNYIPVGKETGRAHRGRLNARTLGSALLAAVTADPLGSLIQALASAIDDVRDRHEHTCGLANPSTPAATVTAVCAERFLFREEVQ